MMLRAFFKRYSGILWNAADYILKLGLTRLLVLPLIASILPEDNFGSLVTAMAVTFIIGGGVTTAHTNYIVKNLGQLEQAQLENQALYLSFRVLPLCALLFFAGAIVLTIPVFEFTSRTFWLWYLVFSIHFCFTAQSEVLISQYRVLRNFRRLTWVHFLSVSLSILILLPSWSFLTDEMVVILSLLVWGVCPSVHAILILRRERKDRPWVRRVAVENKQVFHFFVAALVTFSTGYLDRIMLAFWWPAETVAIFFAAASLAMIMIAPALVLSTYTLSILSKISIEKLRTNRIIFGYAGLVVVISLFVYFGGKYIGIILLELLYPDYFDEASGILHVCVSAAALMTYSVMFMPFVVRYKSASYTSSASVLTFAMRMLLTFYFVREGGFRGAADALYYGSMFTSTIWVVLYFTEMWPSRPSSGKGSTGLD